MKATADEAAAFREECIKWQGRLGLTDWTLRFKTEDAGNQPHEAEADYDCDTRHATVTYYVGIVDALHPRDTALHEMLHLLLADTLVAAIDARDESDPRLAREEHRVIERLLKVMK